MPSKKRKYNARFPAGRIKKIMQTDEEVGKVAQAVPVIISRTLELFVESLLTKSMQITQARNAKTLTPSHMKQCILSESRFDFLKDLVKNIPDASVQEDNENNAICEENSEKNEGDSDDAGNSMEVVTSPEAGSPVQVTANYYNEQSTSTSRTPVIQYGPKIAQENKKINFSVNSLLGQKDEPKLHITIASEQLSIPSVVSTPTNKSTNSVPPKVASTDNIPPLIPISNAYCQNSGDNLCIDEDYDN
ncbi:dr1-associated corepressor [Anoplophora glabripennis]|nr:dr1-associated corepressor [Anoplophora glabripennis]XP_018578220.1 dr1-associated corepressor [Anoplophora glabripennis]